MSQRAFTLTEFLTEEVKPALGCTEPGAVALAVAKAKEYLQGAFLHAKIIVSDGIFKNGASVGIPGTAGMKGNNIAAALSILQGNAAYGLEVLKDCTPDIIPQAVALLGKHCIEIHADTNFHGVYIHALLKDDAGHTAQCIIEGQHDNITKIYQDDALIYDTQRPHTKGDNPEAPRSIAERIRTMPYSQVVTVLESMTDADVDYLLQGARMNMDMALKGIEMPLGLQTGRTILQNIPLLPAGRDLASQSLRIKAYTAAAADARMGGLKEAVMSSAGSGNHGLTAIIPITMMSQVSDKSSRQLAEALAFSHLSTSYIKSRLGRLSPVCGCTACAGAGAAAGLVYMLAQDEPQTTDISQQNASIRQATINKAANAMAIILGNLAGMICDGAKDTCALKVGTAALEACHAALLALKGHYPELQGIVDESIESTVKNLEYISHQGMRDMDKVIINIVESRTK